jgi:hypothetical protein
MNTESVPSRFARCTSEASASWIPRLLYFAKNLGDGGEVGLQKLEERKRPAMKR